MKDTQRIEVLQALMDARLTLARVAQVSGRGERRVRRLLARARAEGPAGMLPGSCGRTPANCSDDRLWQQVLTHTPSHALARQ